MMQKNIFKLLSILLSFAVISSCIKTDFDEPPYVKEYEHLTPNITVKELKARHTNGALETIEEDLILGVLVAANDKSGNYYKTLIVQDETGGMELKINATNMFNLYPEGRKLYIRVKGLTMGDYNGNFQLGKGSYLDDNGAPRLSSIEEVNMDEHILRSVLDQPLTAKIRTIAELGPDDENTLVQLDDMEFAASDLGSTYSVVGSGTSVNRTIKNCGNATLTLRTSSYANFAGDTVPTGKGTIVGIYSIFGTTKQFFLRKREDVQFNNPRCGASGGGEQLMNISDVRALFSGSKVNAPADSKIKGIVITDRANSNITNKNLVIYQPGDAGIVVRFDENNPFNLGDEVEIIISGMEISEFDGLLQINNVTLSTSTTRLSTGKSVTPQSVTIAELNSNFEQYESELVKLTDVTLSKSSGSNFSGNVELKDGTGSIIMYTTTYATFANDAFPATAEEIVGVVGQGGAQNVKQVSIRNKNDIKGGGGGGTTGDLDEKFDGITNESAVNINGWLNVAEVGSRTWLGKTFSSEKYAQATAYNSTDPENIMWLITPVINQDQPKVLTFKSALQYHVHDGLEVLVSSDFDGADYKNATWQKLNPTLANSSTANNVWVESGAVDLSSFGSKIYIAFKYSGTAAANTTSFRIDDVKISNK